MSTVMSHDENETSPCQNMASRTHIDARDHHAYEKQLGIL